MAGRIAVCFKRTHTRTDRFNGYFRSESGLASSCSWFPSRLYILGRPAWTPHNNRRHSSSATVLLEIFWSNF